MSGTVWPALPYEPWQATRETLHAHTQILGKLGTSLRDKIVTVQRSEPSGRPCRKHGLPRGSYARQDFRRNRCYRVFMVRPGGFEPPTRGLEVQPRRTQRTT